VGGVVDLFCDLAAIPSPSRKERAVADRVLELAASAKDNFLQVVPHRVQADPSISTE